MFRAALGSVGRDELHHLVMKNASVTARKCNQRIIIDSLTHEHPKLSVNQRIMILLKSQWSCV